jgi:hypothetical protein
MDQFGIHIDAKEEQKITGRVGRIRFVVRDRLFAKQLRTQKVKPSKVDTCVESDRTLNVADY